MTFDDVPVVYRNVRNGNIYARKLSDRARSFQRAGADAK
jgi:hypothetical protein